ncbi:ASB2, partial [Symbiodinium sp. CCMP2456]
MESLPPPALRVWKISGDEVATLSAEDALDQSNVRSLKRYLAREHGMPGFCQRLLQNGLELDDQTVLEFPSELQLVMVPSRVASYAEELQLANSIRSRDLQQAELILGKPCDLKRSVLRPILSAAAAAGHTDCVDLLLFASPRPALDNLGEPLHMGSYGGCVDIVRLLLHARADKDTLISGETPLSKSAGRGHVEVLSLLLEAGADTQMGSPLCSACASGVAQAVRMLLSTGADKNKRASDGPPVYIASDKGYTDILKMLLEARANANDTSGDDTPLYRASFRGYAVTVRLLLEAMATVNTPVHGETPWAAACWRGHSKTVKLLLNAKADKDTSSVLCPAIRNGHA